jgi:ABC-type sugar transport system substrate-binding protein
MDSLNERDARDPEKEETFTRRRLFGLGSKASLSSAEVRLDQIEGQVTEFLGSNTSVTRRQLLKAGGVAGLGFAGFATGLAACADKSTPSLSSVASSQSSQGAATGAPGATPACSAASGASGLGPSRKIVWAIAAIGDWNLPVDVGFYDAATALGWDYSKVGVPLAQYSAEAQVNVLEQAILLKPDVLVTDWWVKGEADPLKKAQAAGIYVMSNDADNFPDDRKGLGISWVGSNFRQNGYQLGVKLLDTVTQAGKTTGTFLFGVASPGNANVEDRGKGIDDAVQAWNKANGTTFTYERFPDQAGGDAATSSGLYTAKLTQLGSNLVAASGDATAWPSIIISTLKAKGYTPGQIVLGGFRADPPALSGIQDGWIVASADESFYPFGFVTTMLAWQYLERGVAPSDSTFGGGLIDASNLAAIQQREATIQALAKQYGVKLT